MTTITTADAFEIGVQSAAEYEGNLDEVDGLMAATEELTQARLTPNFSPWYAAPLARDGRGDLLAAFEDGWNHWVTEVHERF